MPNGKISPMTGHWPNSWLPVSSFDARLDAWRRGITTPGVQQNQQPPVLQGHQANNAGNADGNAGHIGGNAR